MSKLYGLGQQFEMRTGKRWILRKVRYDVGQSCSMACSVDLIQPPAALVQGLPRQSLA